ncbi:MAG TPA: FecR domain-containing protein [Puia sp.]|nr:FecR domain-containing protein [Puia sp.]
MEKYRSGNLTGEEKAILESWYNYKARQHGENITDLELEENLRLIAGGLPLKQQVPVRRMWPRVAAAAAVGAAAVLVCLSIGIPGKYRPSAQQTARRQQVDVAPGSDRAILYSQGKMYVLDSIANGVIARQQSVAIDKYGAGQLVYSVTGNTGGTAAVTYDTLTVPAGGQHAIVFADGSSVLLNADSKLRYPERFTGSQRLVELISGEAEFHIRHNAAMPFYVLAKGQTIRDIGTIFNVSAYDDEPVVRTTLIDGSVEVKINGASRVLKPGLQAITGDGEQIDVRTADTNQVTAWTKGQFYFEKTNLRELMRQLGRWYNIDVVYEGNVPDDAFDGQVSRNQSLSQMLKILQFGDVHFRIEPGDGKTAGRLIITP